MHQEPGKAGNQRTGENAAFLTGRQTGKAQHRKRQQIVADNGLPADGKAAVKYELQHAENKAAQQARPKAPAHGIQHQRNHGQHDAAAPGHLPQLDKAEDLCHSHQNSTLAQGAKLHVIHLLLPPKKT